MAIALRERISGLRAMLAAFEHRNFRLLWSGRMTSNMGRTMRTFLRGYLVWDLTGSPFLIGVVTSSLTLPMLIMPFIGGIVADRVDRRRLLILTESSLVVLWTVISLLVSLGLIQWWHFIISGALSGIIQSFGRPGHMAMVANVVDKETLPNAVALDSAALTWPRVVGPALGAALIPFIGVAGCFWLTALGQLFTAFTIIRLQWDPTAQPRERRSIAGSALEGLRFIKGEAALIGLVTLGACITIFAQPYSFLMPVFAEELIGTGGERAAQALGVLMTASAIGASIGSAFAVAISNVVRRGLLLLGVVIIYAFLIAAFSQSQIFLLSLGILFLMGASQITVMTIITTALQLLAPEHMRARIMSLRTVLFGLSPVGVLIMGTLAEPTFLGIRDAVLVGGTLTGVISVLLFAAMPRLRGFR